MTTTVKRYAWLSRFTLLQGAVLPVVLALIWNWAAHRGGAGYTYAFVPLIDIWHSFIELLRDGSLITNLLATLRTVAIGLIVGGSLGLMLGVLMGVSTTIERIIGPLFHMFRQIPELGLAPLFGLWFGNGVFAKMLLVSLAAFYPMVLNAHEGIRSVERRYIEVAHVFKFSRWQLFRHVLLPAAVPSLMTGLMHALAFAWLATVASELLFVAGPGLGGLMQTAEGASRMDIIMLCIITVGVTGLLMNSGFRLFNDYLLRWRGLR